jgi:Skp family chaperone for outer membrane proteins
MKVFMSKFLLLIPSLVFTLLIANSSLAIEDNKFNVATKVAVVDVESILEHSLAVRDIKQKINSISEQIQKELSFLYIDKTLKKLRLI